MEPVHVRHQLVDALRLDLVGPEDGLGDAQEILPQRPSTWYMTGFLVPLEASPDQKTDAQGTDELDAVGDAGGLDDAATPEPAAARVSYLPSSIGASVLVPAAAQQLTIMVRWGDYHMRAAREDEPGPSVWERTPREERVLVTLPAQTAQPLEVAVPQSGGLMVDVAVRPVLTPTSEGGLPPGTRSVSVFLVNRRAPAPDERSDEAFAFQAQLAIHGDRPFVPRPDLRSLESQDWDERVADLHYRDAFEFAVGHSVATAALISDDQACWTVHTCWIPEADVERVAPSQIDGVELSMDTLGHLTDAADAHAKLGALVTQYHAWIEAQRRTLPALPAQRRETAEELLHRATVAAQRIAHGVQLLADPVVLTAFRLANRAMAAAARQRFGVMQGKDPATVQPQWRPFQLAFLLMNLPGMVQPEHADREVVDLLFFPTGGGKTEAYLGLAAFTLVLRRLRHPGLASAGLSVLMRYTLRLLTLDQLGRAATLLCALELERQQDVETLGTWPFEIGLWVGKAATPNVMGARGDRNPDSARARTIAFQNDDRKPSPIPLEDCPWCGTKFKALSFRLVPNPDQPTDLRVTCVNRHCAFTRDKPLPILAVDEPIYRRLPCFMIATVDKFAALPWTGDVGQFFGQVQRADRDGFYGPCHAAQGLPLPVARLLPPDLIIQDELHLISGPLGTMVGLYETALDALVLPDGERPHHPPEDRGVDGHGAPGRTPDSRPVQSSGGGHLPAARPGSAAVVFRGDPSPRPESSPAVSRDCRAGPQPEGRHAARLSGGPGRGAARLPRPWDEEGPGQPG